MLHAARIARRAIVDSSAGVHDGQSIVSDAPWNDPNKSCDLRIVRKRINPPAFTSFVLSVPSSSHGSVSSAALAKKMGRHRS